MRKLIRDKVWVRVLKMPLEEWQISLISVSLGSLFGFGIQYLLLKQQIAENRKNLELQFKNQSENLDRQLKSNANNLKSQLYHNEQKGSLEKLWEIVNSDIPYDKLKKELQLFIKSKMGYYLPEELQGNINSIISQTDYKIYELEVGYGMRPSIEQEEAMYGGMEETIGEMLRDGQPWEIANDEIGHEINACKSELQEILRKFLATPSARS